MSTINIGGDAADASYRYKMPRVIPKVEGRGNGIKTVIVNVVDIARALHVDPEWPTKFWGLELGAQSKFDYKRDVGIVNGKHDAPDLQEVLGRFIDLFVLCPRCKLPEIKLRVKKTSIKLSCASCGENRVLKTAHKLEGYIIRNPPKKKGKDAKDGKSDKDKKDKKKKKKRKKKDDEDGGSGEDGGEDADEEKSAKKKKDKKKKKKKKKKKDDEDGGSGEDGGEDGGDGADAGDADGDADGDAAGSAKAEKPKKKKKKKNDDDGVEWFTDTSKEAQEARRAQEYAEMKSRHATSSGGKNSSGNGGDGAGKGGGGDGGGGGGAGTGGEKKKTVDDILKQASKAGSFEQEPAVDVLRRFLARGGRSVVEIKGELRRLQLSRGLDGAQSVLLLVEALIDVSQRKTVADQFGNHAAVLKAFADGRAAATLLISGVEHVLGEVEPKLAKYMPLVLQTLFEKDVLTEEAIRAWYHSAPESSWLIAQAVAQDLRVKTKPLIEWFEEEADGSSSSDSDSDDDEEEEEEEEEDA